MQISPGTQLVWSLSGSEAVNLGMPKIEPDHLFCGLLKFSELSDDTIGSLLNNNSDIPTVVEERDDLALALEDLGKSTVDIRHAVRKEAEHGTHKLEGNLIHRSDASRKLFEKAIEKANSQNQPVKPTHLLAVILAEPTPAMNKVLHPEDDLPKWLEEQEEEKPAPGEQRYTWMQPVEELAPKKGYRVPETSDPQRLVIGKALTDANPSPLLLICDERIDALPLLWKTSGEYSNLNLLVADQAKMLASLAELDDPGQTGSEIVRAVEDTLQNESTWLFFDLTDSTPVEESTWNDLEPLIQKQPRLILAVRESLYQNKIRPNAGAEAVFHTIWLHDLSFSRAIKQI